MLGKSTITTEMDFMFSCLRPLKNITIGDFKKSLTSEAKALEFSQNIQNNIGEAEALEYLGIAYTKLQKLNTAFISYDQALIAYQQTNNLQSEHRLLLNLCKICLENKLFQKHIDYAKSILTIIEKLNSKYTPNQIAEVKAYKASALSDIGVSYGNLRQYEQQLNFCQQALDIYRIAQASETKALYLANTGLANFNLGVETKDDNKMSEAQDYLQQSLEIYQKQSNTPKEIEILIKLGNVQLGYPKSENEQFLPTELNHYQQQAIEISARKSDLGTTFIVLDMIGNQYQCLKQYKKNIHKLAIQYYKKLANLNNPQMKAHYFLHMGVAYQSFDEFSEATEYYLQAISIYKDLGDLPRQLNVLMKLGVNYENSNQLQLATDTYQQILTYQQTLGNKKEAAVTLNALGIIADKLEQFNKAIEYYQLALSLYQQIKETKEIATTLSNLSIAYRHLQRYEEAKKCVEQSIRIYQELKDYQGESRAYLNLGNILINSKQFQQGNSYYQKSLNIAKKINNDTLIKKASSSINKASSFINHK